MHGKGPPPTARLPVLPPCRWILSRAGCEAGGSRGQGARRAGRLRPSYHLPGPAACSCLTHRPSFICALGAQQKGRKLNRGSPGPPWGGKHTSVLLICIRGRRDEPTGRTPPQPAPPCMASPGIGQDVCHLWVLGCKSQPTLLGFPAVFLLLDEPWSFQAPLGQALSGACRCYGYSGLQDTPRTSVPESMTPWSPAPDTADPTAKLPLPPPQPQTHPRPKASGTRRGIVSSHDHGEGKDQNSVTWGREEVQDPKAQHAAGLPHAPRGPCLFPVPQSALPTQFTPLIPTALSGLSLGVASSRPPSLTTPDTHRCPSSLSLSSLHSPPPCGHCHSWDGRSYRFVCLPLQL